VHFQHNDALVITMHINSCGVSLILIDSGRSDNILYGSTLDRMQNSSEIAQAMIYLQTQSNLYGLDRNETRSPGTIGLLVRANPHNTITEFYVIDVKSPQNAFLGQPWIYMMKVIPSSYH